MQSTIKSIVLYTLVTSAVAAQTQTITYDALRRIASVDYGDGLTVVYSYDDNGNRFSRTITSPYNIPTITSSPTAQTATIGQPATFTVVAAGNPAVSYQWRKAGGTITGATNTTYTIPAIALSDGDLFDVVVTNTLGTTTSGSASLFVSKLAQFISFSTPRAKTYGDAPFPLIATSTSGLSVRFSVLDGPGSILGTTLSLTGIGTVSVRASQAGNDTYYAASNMESNIEVLPSFSSWRELNFTLAELADLSRSGPNAVYGQDGVSNLVKYALGLNPKVNVASALPPPLPQGMDWTVTYTRPADRTEITYTIELSTNLTTWTTTGVTHEFVSSSGGVETWRVRYPLASTPNVNFRLKVSRP